MPKYVFSHIQSKYVRRAKKTPYLDTFYAVFT